MTTHSFSCMFLVRVMTLIVAIASIIGLTCITYPSQAHADANRDRLRAGCEWDPYNWWVQYCRVFSPSMGRTIPVHIKAATGGGNAGLYLLDGLYGFNPGASGWIWSGHVAETFANDNITLVAPASGDASFYTDWNGDAITSSGVKKQKWETFLTSELPDYLQREFGVSRSRNAIAGLSMGASAAMTLGSRHRDQFKQITALSGYYQLSNPVVATSINGLELSAGVVNPSAMWGFPVPASQERIARDPSRNINSLSGMPMYISSANGIPSLFSDPSILNRPVEQLPNVAWRSVMESLSRASTRQFERDVRNAGITTATFVYSGVGIHSWDLWSKDTQQARPHILRALGV